MKIRVDRPLCEANALCVDDVPEVFSLDDQDELQLLTDAPDEALRDRVEMAVRMCPRNALTVED